MNFLKKRLTVLVLPDDLSPSRSVSFSSIGAYVALTFSSVVLILLVYLAASYFSAKVDQIEIATLKEENLRLGAKFEDLRAKLATADERFQDLVRKEIALRNIFKMKDVNTEERLMGVGGQQIMAASIFGSASENVETSEATLDRLLKLADFESERFVEVEAKMMAVKHQLDHTPSLIPARGYFSRGYGMKFDPFTGARQMHRGVDLAGPVGTPIIAPANGMVKEAHREPDFGNMILIDHGYGFVTRYAHLSAFKVKPGEIVTRGQVIGLMGSTGRSTGSHLHYEVYKNGSIVDPRPYLASSK